MEAERAENTNKMKERQLEEQLRGRHCRPLIKLFKIMQTPQFNAEFADDSSELSQYIQNSKAQLRHTLTLMNENLT